MKTREASTVTKLLCLSFRLILATAQPRTQERISTMRETAKTIKSPPRMAAGPREALIQ